MSTQVRPANLITFDRLMDFVNDNHLSFLHPDWLSPRDRLLQEGCYGLLDGEGLLALMSATIEVAPVAWLRFFISLRDGNHAVYFSNLFRESARYLRAINVHSLYALPMAAWFIKLLEDEGFQVVNHLVNLLLALPWEGTQNPIPDLVIRQMASRDLDKVKSLDSQAFPPLWQLDEASLQKTYHSGAYLTVAYLDDTLVGYQMTTSAFDHAHLARLAVDPAFQGQGFGGALLKNMLEEMTRLGYAAVSVNTQADNASSLSVYRKQGFRPEGEPIPVYCLGL